jgi:hypothetical protein
LQEQFTGSGEDAFAVLNSLKTEIKPSDVAAVIEVKPGLLGVQRWI